MISKIMTHIFIKKLKYFGKDNIKKEIIPKI